MIQMNLYMNNKDMIRSGFDNENRNEKTKYKKSIKARTTGKIKRDIKRAIIPGYGKKGMGWVKDPERAMKNKVYNKTTFGLKDIFNLFK